MNDNLYEKSIQNALFSAALKTDGLFSLEFSPFFLGIFDWQDVTEVSPKRLKSEGLTLADGLRLLHAKDKNGDLKIGVDAFILIWSQLNRWHILAKIVSLPGIRQIAGIAYTFFANKRFAKLEHCQLAAKKENK